MYADNIFDKKKHFKQQFFLSVEMEIKFAPRIIFFYYLKRAVGNNLTDKNTSMTPMILRIL